MTSDFPTCFVALDPLLFSTPDGILSVGRFRFRSQSVEMYCKYDNVGIILSDVRHSPRRPDATLTTSTASSHLALLAVCVSPCTASPKRSRTTGKNCKNASVEGRTALALLYAWALAPGKERFPAEVVPKLAAHFGAGEIYPQMIWARAKERVDRGAGTPFLGDQHDNVDGRRT